MNTALDRAIQALQSVLPGLTSVQVEALTEIATAFATPVDWEVDSNSDFASEDFARLLGDVLVVHHVLSTDSFTKDKFEHAMVNVLNKTDHAALIAARGNPGHDLTVDGGRWSLKTQADASIRRDRLHISKFMELGKGRWENEEDLEGLRAAMFRHMESYDRIFSLRCLSAHRSRRGSNEREYELVEVPKSLLLRAADSPCVMRHESRQSPKPGICQVLSDNGIDIEFELYFDGGTERKLQIRHLSKGACRVHACWRFRSS